MVLALPALGLRLAAGLLAPQLGETGGFEAYLWRSAPAPAPMQAALEAVGGTLVLPGEPIVPLLERGLELLLFNAPGRDELHLERDRTGYRERWQRWYDTRADELLVRVPCLSEPPTLALLERRLAAALEVEGVARLRGISLGDEVGLTPHGAPEDVCLCPHCQEAWRRFLAGQPDVSPQERERFAALSDFSTDATRLALADGRTQALRPWLLRRRFHEALLRAVLERLAARARSLAPGVPVGLLGIQPQSAFGTPRQELLLDQLDFAEAYREIDARELLLTLRGPAQRALLTVFPSAQRLDLATWQIWEHWLRGGDGVVVWSDAALASSPAVLQSTARALREVGAVEAAVPGFAPRPAGAAVVHDFESLCVSWLRDALLDGPTWPRRFASHQAATGSWETALTAWLALLADCGLQPGSLPLEQVGAAARERFGLLVLSELCVLDPGDLERLTAFLGAGGTLLVWGPLGWVDAHGRSPKEDPFQRLQALAPERVVRVEGRLPDYPLERARRTLQARMWRETARTWLAGAGVASAPWRVVGALEELPWLCAWSEGPDRGLICATLPAWHDVQGQGSLPELAVEIEPAAGWELRWIRPAIDSQLGTRLLAPGEAAVFRLLAREQR